MYNDNFMLIIATGIGSLLALDTIFIGDLFDVAVYKGIETVKATIKTTLASINKNSCKISKIYTS